MGPVIPKEMKYYLHYGKALIKYAKLKLLTFAAIFNFSICAYDFLSVRVLFFSSVFYGFCLKAALFTMRRNILFNILSYEKEYFIQYFALFRPILNIQNDSVLDYDFEIFKHLQNPYFFIRF